MAGTNRRTLLGRVAVAAPAVALALPASASGADPHPAWEGEAAAELDRIEAMPADAPDEAGDPHYDRLNALRDLIGSTPARTAAGAAVQVRLALDCHLEGSCLGGCEVAGLRNALATLDRLATVAAALAAG